VFSGTVPVKKTGTDLINVKGGIAKTAGPAFCPAAGEITGDFTVTQDTSGLGIIIH
jgi:hypothetical protein